MRPGTRIAVTLFLIIAFAHLLRLIFMVPITAGEWRVPQWISLLGVVLPLVVAWLLWKENSN
jgi:hypothetical protein